MCFLELFRGRVVDRWNDMYLFGAFLFGGSNAEKCIDHRKKNFFVNNYVGLSMFHDPIETVKYIWVNIWCMLDWSFSQNCRNKFNSFAYSWLTSEEYKNLDAVVPDELLATNANIGSYQVEEYKNSSLVIILHYLNKTTTWYFHYLYVLLRVNHEINAVCFLSFHNGCNPSLKCDIGSGRENRKDIKKLKGSLTNITTVASHGGAQMEECN